MGWSDDIDEKLELIEEDFKKLYKTLNWALNVITKNGTLLVGKQVQVTLDWKFAVGVIKSVEGNTVEVAFDPPIQVNSWEKPIEVKVISLQDAVNGLLVYLENYNGLE